MEFSFRHAWVVPAPLERVHSVLVDLERYPEWWPQVLAVASLGPDTARVLCRSTLPFTLDLVLDAVHREPTLLETALGGDLDGFARWRLQPVADGTSLSYEQEVVARGWLALAARVAGPVLRWNHARMMAACRAGLAARASG